MDNQHKQYRCSKCTFSTDDRKSLNQHVESQHHKQFQCPLCRFSTIREKALVSHKKKHHSGKEKKFQCNYCRFSTTQRKALDRHVSLRHECGGCGRSFFRILRHKCKGWTAPKNKKCPTCNKTFERLSRHRCRKIPAQQQTGGGENNDETFGKLTRTKSTQGGKILTYSYFNEDPLLLDIPQVWTILHADVTSLLKYFVNKQRGLRVEFGIEVMMVNPIKDDEFATYLRSGYIILMHENFIPGVILRGTNFVDNSLVNFNERGSGCTLAKIVRFDVMVSPFRPLRGRGWRELPEYLKNRKGLVYIPGTGNQCWKLAFLAAMHYHDKEIQGLGNRSRRECSVYEPYAYRYDFSSIKYPVEISSVSKFEAANGVGICVYGFDEEADENPIYPLRIADGSFDKLVQMLYTNKHYIAIHSLSALLGKKGTHSQYICNYCLCSFSVKQRLENHVKVCSGFGATAVNLMPLNDDGTAPQMEFLDFEKTIRFTAHIFADFECLSVPESKKFGQNTVVETELHPCAVGMLLVHGSNDPEYFEHWGPDCAKVFIDKALEWSDRVIEQLNQDDSGYLLDSFDERELAKADKCNFCDRQFSKSVPKVRHHQHKEFYQDDDHYNGLLGITCQACNLRLKPKKHVPVVFHNLSGFDAKLITKYALGHENIEDIQVFPKNSEKFSAIWIERAIKIIDSLGKLGGGLDALIKSAKSRSGAAFFKRTRLHFQRNYQLTDSQFEYVMSKQVFCYNYIDSFERLQETQIPDIKWFYNQLEERTATEEEYEYFKHVYHLFQCKNLGDYYAIYLAFDVFALADLYMAHADVCYASYGLDVSHYLTPSSYSYAALMYTSKLKLDYVTDVDLALFLREATVGGVVLQNVKKIEANMPGLKNYDPEKPRFQALYLDAASLYGSILTGPLPWGNFKRLTREDLDDLCADDFAKLRSPRQDGTAYFLRVSCHCPPNRQDDLLDMPLFPMKYAIQTDDLSDLQLDQIQTIYGGKAPKMERVACTFFPARNYPVHSQYLAIALALGYVIDEVSDGWSFSEAPIFKSYVEGNLAKRAATTCSIASAAYKLNSNCLFGFTILDLFKRVEVRIARSPKELEPHLNNPLLQSVTEISDKVSIVTLKKRSVDYVFPTFVGVSVLHRSKWLMAHLIYERTKFGIFRDRFCKLAYSDTDSGIFLIALKPGEDNVYHLLKGQDFIDCSTYPKDHPCYDDRNRGRVGIWKDEIPGQLIEKAIFLAAKSYCIKLADGSETLRAKGVRRYKHKTLNYDMYEEVLETGTSKNLSMYAIRSFKHTLYVCKVTKSALSSLNLKAHFENKYSSKPFGHYSLVTYRCTCAKCIGFSFQLAPVDA